jgi:hypothetical protein
MKLLASAHPAIAKFMDSVTPDCDSPPPRDSLFLPSITEGIYNELLGVRSSHLKSILRSDDHFIHQITTPHEATKSQNFGTLCHHAILYPEEKLPILEIPDDLNLNSKEGRETKAVAESEGLIVTRKYDVERISAIKEVIHSDPDLSQGITAGFKEASISVTVPINCGDSTHYLRIKSRFDCIVHGDFFIDLKFSGDARPDSWVWRVKDFMYHLQAQHYLTVWNHADRDKAGNLPDKLRGGRSKFLFVVVEQDPPHGMNKFLLGEDLMMQGAFLWAQATEKLVNLALRGETKGYDSGITILKAPSSVGSRYVEEVL